MFSINQQCFQKRRKKERLPDTVTEDLVMLPNNEAIVCPECNGKGECRNPNHFQFDVCDIDYENAYVVCPRCFGTGYILKIEK